MKDKLMDWATKVAMEALIGMQNHSDAMMKLTEEERNSLLFSVAASLRENEEPWRDFVEHLLAMDVVTPGGSNEGWAKQLLNNEK